LKKAFYSSLSIHLLVFILISVTLPEIKTKEIDFISIEIINEEVNENKIIEEKVVKEKVVKKNEDKIKEKEVIKYKPQPPRKKPIIKKENNEVKKIAIKPKPPQKKPDFKIKEKEINKNIEDTQKENEDHIFDNMLKNLAKYEEQPTKPQKQIINKPKQESKKSIDEIKNIQRSIISKIYKQIKENYSLPPAPDLKVLDDITVQLRIYVSPDGTINKTVVNKNSLKRAAQDPTYLPYVEAAQRAIKKLGKFSKLPEKEYKLWKIIDISFTPYQT